MITKAEFIRAYVERSNKGSIDDNRLLPTETGFVYADGTHPHVALRCRCGEDNCEGWAMIPDDRERYPLYSMYEMHRAQNNSDDESED